MNTEMLKMIMLDKNLNIPKLSQKTGISVGRLSEILSGKVKNPRIDTVKKIARVLEVDINEIIN